MLTRRATAAPFSKRRYGGTLLQTPHINKLAREGVRFTDGYATAAVCGPSRSGIITGTYQQRFGMQANPDGNRYTVPARHKVMPEALSAVGYKTGMFGKWNMPQGKGAEVPPSNGSSNRTREDPIAQTDGTEGCAAFAR